MWLILLLLLVLLVGPVSGQKWTVESNADSSLVIYKDDRFDDVVKRQRQENLERQTIPGYRIQIYFGVNRPKASEVKLDFGERYPEMPAYLTYQQPNYKVRVGDFRNRYDALQFLDKIQGLYPTTFVVPDDVKLPPVP